MYGGVRKIQAESSTLTIRALVGPNFLSNQISEVANPYRFLST